MRVGTTFLGLLVVVGAGGCGGGGATGVQRTPDRTAEAWSSAITRGDFAAACDLMTPAAVRSLRDGTPCSRAVRRFHARYPRLARPAFLGTIASQEQADHVVTLSVSDERGGPQVRLVRQGDAWRITRVVP